MSNIGTQATKTCAGMLESAIQKPFARSAEVVDVKDVGPVFRIVTVGGEALRSVDCSLNYTLCRRRGASLVHVPEVGEPHASVESSALSMSRSARNSIVRSVDR